MPAGARRSLASPAVVNGVLCQCGGGGGGSSSSSSSGGPVPVAAESPSPALAEHERRLHSLFVQLDVNRDGALCVHDLAVGLQRLGLHRSERDLWGQARRERAKSLGFIRTKAERHMSGEGAICLLQPGPAFRKVVS